MKTVLVTSLVFLAACASGATRHGAESKPSPAVVVLSEEIPPTDAGETRREFTVPTAVAFALEQNPDLQVAAHRIAAAKQEVEVARAAWMPTLGVGLDFAYSNDPANVLMMKLRQRDLDLGPGTDLNDPGWQTNTRVSVTAGWQVYDGGRRTNLTELRRLQVLLTEGDRDAVLNELKAAVIDTSLAVFMADEFGRVALESVRLTEEQVKMAATRHELGQAQRSDLLSAEVRLAQARETLVQAENARARAITALRNLLGLRADAPLELVGTGEFHVPPVGVEDLVDVAAANRPEVKQAADAVRLAEREVELHRAGYRPTLSVFGSYDVNNELADFSFDGDSGTVGLSFEWSVFEGGRTNAQVAAAKARLEAARVAERKARLAVGKDAAVAQLRLTEAAKRLEVSRKSTEQADEALRLIRALYQNGAATITEYLDAEVALTGARVRNVSARYDVERATADLRRALGICRAAPEAVQLDDVTGDE